MAANTAPIFTNIPSIEWATVITTVNTATTAATYDGTTNANLVFAADATDGSFIKSLIFEALGTNAASYAHIYINNGSTNGTASNNSPILCYALPATTASNTTVPTHVEVVLNIQLPPSYRIYVSLHAAASPLASGWCVTGIGGDY